VPQATGFLRDAIVQLLMPLGKAPLFGGVRRYPPDVADKLLIALPDLRERGLRPPLRVTCLFGLQHDEFLDTFEPRRRTVDLCTQGRVMFGVGGSQLFDFTKRGRSHVAQRLVRLRADGIPFGRGCFGQPESSVTTSLGLRVVSKHYGKSCLLVVKLAANGANFDLKFRIDALECPRVSDGRRRFRFEFVPTLRKDLFALLNRKRPHRHHRIRDRRRQCCGERVVARLLVLPQLQFVIDGGATALTDFRLDQVDGELMREPAHGDESRGGFADADSGVTDTAHGRGFTVKGGWRGRSSEKL
jgi:hypothetical protein